MEEVVRTFYNLVTLGVRDGALGQTEKNAAFSDQITFRTRFLGSVNPTLVLSPVTNRFKLTQATATVEADRVDTHRVIIAIRLPEKFEDEFQLKESLGRQINELRMLDAFRRRDF